MAERRPPKPPPAAGTAPTTVVLPDAGDRRWRLVGTLGALALGLVHALVVAPHYHVGSFDDDASYVMAGRALAAGHGLTSRLAGGYPLIGVYPPGYPTLLTPLAAIWREGTLALRVESLGLFAIVFPLTSSYLRRRRVPVRLCLAVLALLALNPVLATYATMVMPEIAFVVVFLLLLLAVDRWEHQPRTISWAGAGTVLCAGGLLWLKEAGLGLVIGVVAWLLVRRLLRKAVVAAIVPAVLLLPLLVVRAQVGANLIGSRYSNDLSGAFHGGLWARLVHMVPAAARTYLTQAVPRSIVPTLAGFLPNDGPIGALLLLVTWTAAPLVVVGFVVWCRRHADATCLSVPVYLAETLVYPYTNERRVVLVLPVIVAWYALGASSVVAALHRVASRRPVHERRARRLAAGAPFCAGFVVLAALGSQFTRDYLYFEGASSSAPEGSPYMALLRRLGTPREVVETDYLWTTALFSGHRTLNGAYAAGCDGRRVADAIRADSAGYLLTAELNGGGAVDDACILPAVAALPEAVRLYRTARDQASVFELVGPGTGHPELRDMVADAAADGGTQPITWADEAPQTSGDPAGRYATVTTTTGEGALTWSWPHPVAVTQISLGAAGALTRHMPESVKLSVRISDGTWRVVAATSGAVGSGTQNPFLLVHLTDASAVTAVRVSVTVTGSATIAVHDLHTLGAGA